MSDGVRIDGMCIGILRDVEVEAHVDYFYVADLWAPDPRYESRQMNIGQSRGLFRIQKQTLDAELIYRAFGDNTEKCFLKAASKVIREFKAVGSWVDRSQYAAG